MPLPTTEAAIKALAEHLDEPESDDYVKAAATAARDLVAGRLTAAEQVKIPDAVGQLAVVEAGAAVYYRRTARNGITTFGGAEVIPMRIAKDPLSTVYPILAPYTGPGFS